MPSGKYKREPGARAGEFNPYARLTDEKVIQARLDRQKGMGFRALARKYGVSYPTIRRAVIGESWTYIITRSYDLQPQEEPVVVCRDAESRSHGREPGDQEG